MYIYIFIYTLANNVQFTIKQNVLDHKILQITFYVHINTHTRTHTHTYIHAIMPTYHAQTQHIYTHINMEHIYTSNRPHIYIYIPAIKRTRRARPQNLTNHFRDMRAS